MKQLSTKSIGSLLAATATAIGDVGRRAGERHLERVLRRHDRKGELRANIFGISPLEFRELQRRYTFDEMIKLYGFKSQSEFRLALLGKLRAELLQRGWSRQKIDRYVDHKPIPIG